ncbi:KAP family P-loop NTPase fold protein [Prevotella sp.]|uniref:KAP family P-loop NTPase fold protein n=1 Tax=Prevotella sp. TaxID=59823 RepID=UPI003DA318EE
MNNTTSDNAQEHLSMIADIKKKLSDAKIKSLIVTSIKKILSDFNTKLIFILVSLFVLCNAFIIGVIDDYIANGILSGFDDNIAERILFIFVGIALIYYTGIDIHNNKKVSNSRFGWAFTFLLFWAYYRLLSDEWTYVKFWNLKYLSYIDIVPLYSLLIIIKTAYCKRVPRIIDESKGFEADLPIDKVNSDFLERDNIAKGLAIKIKNTPIEKCAFSIGIESPWGEGKTSFLYLLCKHVEDKDTIIIKFNPWNYEKERNLVDAFFLELRENLKKYDSSLSTNLTEYARILSDSNHDIIKFGAKFVECFSSQSIEVKREVINSAIKEINKLILVVIDDLDRLDKDEIMSVLKLIRNSANFSNMVFVSAYDRDYLIETLKDDVCKSNKYIEKIFQYQFKLPKFSKMILRSLLSIKGKKFIDDSDEKQFKEILGIDTQANQLQNNCILSNLDNLRDVYRFINSFQFAYQKLKGDTQIKDLMMIELLRMKYYDVYELLSKEYEKYLIITGDTFRLWNAGLQKQDHVKNNHSDIFAIIGGKYKKASKEFRQIESLLNVMFPANSPSEPKAINNSYYIDRYFYYSLNFDISEKEFKTVMEKPYSEIKQNIDVWLRDYKVFCLSDLLALAKISNAEEYKKVIKSIFYVGYKKQGIFFKFKVIYNIIKKSHLTPEDNKAFLYDVFFENGASQFVSKFIHDLLYYSDEISNVIFTAEEFNNISAEMFKLLCVNETSFQTIYYLWENTLYYEHVQSDDNTKSSVAYQNKKADTIFIEYIKTNYKTMLPQLINKDFDDRAFISNTYFEPWNGQKGFKSFIDELLTLNKDDKQLKEFSEFVTKYFNNQAAVEFDFKDIKINL